MTNPEHTRSRAADVVLLDVVQSSAERDRDRLQERLVEFCEESNELDGADLLGRFEITRGDEVAAVYRQAAPLLELVERAEERLSPHRLRYVVRRGELTAGLESGRSTVIDGPAFWRAGEAMEELKKTELPILIEWPNETAAALVTSLFAFRILHTRGLTELQRTILRLYRELRNQTRVAERIGRTQQQVQKTLAACHQELMDHSEQSLREVLRTGGEP
ncbi:MAG: SatD family protein [Planctomycetota bacterium]